MRLRFILRLIGFRTLRNSTALAIFSVSLLLLAGCGSGGAPSTTPDTATGFYVHAKAVVPDYGLPTQMVYMGSINYSTASMTENRELGIYITDQTIIDTLNTTIAADYAGGQPY